MRSWKRSMITTGVLTACVLTAMATAQGRKSPHETAKATIDGATVSIDYGRPSMKGRKIMGELVPYGQVWRTGADEATILTTDKPLDIGGVSVPAGKVSLYTLPSEGEWKLIVNKQTGHWGTDYNEKQDIGRATVTKKTLSAPVEQFTITLDKNPAGGGLLKLSWENTELSVPIKAKG